MHRKLISRILCLVFLHGIMMTSPAIAVDSSERLKTIENSKAVVAKAYANKGKIRVVLPDGRKIVGKVTEKNLEDFVISDSKTAATTRLSYAGVTSVTKQGLSTGSKVLIGIGIGVGATVAIFALAIRNGLKNSKCCTI